MLLTTLFSLPVDVNVADVRLEQETLTLVLKSSQTSAVCPECSHASTRIRGRYTRTLADLPSPCRAVRVRLEVRRFVCRTRGCPRTTFAERFPQLSRAYARRTLRQAEALIEVAFANGGKAGAQLAKRLAMPTSRDTLLRLIPNTRPHRCSDSTISPGKKATATAPCWSTCKRIARWRSYPIGKRTPSSAGCVRIGV